MNIAQAKEELINTVKTYLAKDKDGCYRIPRVQSETDFAYGTTRNRKDGHHGTGGKGM